MNDSLFQDDTKNKEKDKPIKQVFNSKPENSKNVVLSNTESAKNVDLDEFLNELNDVVGTK